MSLVTVHAQAPWGPVQLRTAESMGELLARGERPAEIVDVGERDPAEVVKVALRLLPPPMDASGQLPATVDKARNSVMEAVSCVVASVVADAPAEPVSGKPESHCEPIASDGEVKPEIAHKIAAGSCMAAADCSAVRHQAGAEVDVRVIRAGLKLSQPEFAKAFGLKVAVLRDWEQGRTTPEGAARVLLRVIEARPEVVKQVLEGVGCP